jgi:uncharacterized protein YwgA
MPNNLNISLNNEEKIVIYSIGALDNTPLRSKTKLHKILFLFSNVFKNFQDILEFEPHLLGPYSETVDYVLDDLIRLDLVEKRNNSFSLTNKGLMIFNSLKPKEDLTKVVEDFKDFLNDLTDDEVLTFIYVFYPQYIAESARWNELKKNRIKIAISLLRKQKISFTKASEIAGLNINEFEDLLRKRNIRWKK